MNTEAVPQVLLAASLKCVFSTPALSDHGVFLRRGTESFLSHTVSGDTQQMPIAILTRYISVGEESTHKSTDSCSDEITCSQALEHLQ